MSNHHEFRPALKAQFMNSLHRIGSPNDFDDPSALAFSEQMEGDQIVMHGRGGVN
jgi:hypothetical protein